jgi:hypothetical protein
VYVPEPQRECWSRSVTAIDGAGSLIVRQVEDAQNGRRNLFSVSICDRQGSVLTVSAS